MSSNEAGLLAVLAKQLRELREAFRALAKQQGPAGRDGNDGAAGPRGHNGMDGERGPPGSRGPAGRDGVDGKDGTDGERGPMPDHQWKATKLRFQKPDGTWGRYVELKGEKGQPSGVPVSVSMGGGWSPYGIAPAGDELPDGFLVRQSGEWVVATYAQMSTWLGGGAPPESNAILTEDGDVIVTEAGDRLIQE